MSTDTKATWCNTCSDNDIYCGHYESYHSNSSSRRSSCASDDINITGDPNSSASQLKKFIHNQTYYKQDTSSSQTPTNEDSLQKKGKKQKIKDCKNKSIEINNKLIKKISSSMYEAESDCASDSKTGRSSTYDISEIQDEELQRVDTEADISEMLDTCSDIDNTENADLSATENDWEDDSEENMKTLSDEIITDTSYYSNPREEKEDEAEDEEDTDVDITDDDIAADDVNDDDIGDLQFSKETEDYWLKQADDDTWHLKFDDHEDDLSICATENPDDSFYYYSNTEDIDSSDTELEEQDDSCADESHKESYT